MANMAADEESAGSEALADANAEPKAAAGFDRRAIKKAAAVLGGLLALVVLTSLPPVRHVILDNQPRIKEFIHNTVTAVILFRQIPLPGMVTNAVLGLSPIRRREFFLGTGIGLLPEAVPMVLIGSGLRKEDLGQTVLYLFGAVALFIAGWVAWGAYTRRAGARAAAVDKAG